MATGDIFQVTLTAEIENQQCLNVFYYRQFGDSGGGDDDAAQLTTLFNALFMGEDSLLLSSFISADLEYRSIRIVNIFNSLDFFEQLLTGKTGAGAGSYLPTFNAFYYRTRWLGPSIRRGMKRFAGVVEEAIVDGRVGTPLPSVFLDFAEYLGTPLSDNPAVVFSPVVVKRVKVPNGKGGFDYILPTSPALATGTIAATDWEFVNSITTQSSRKIGRGS